MSSTSLFVQMFLYGTEERPGLPRDRPMWFACLAFHPHRTRQSMLLRVRYAEHFMATAPTLRRLRMATKQFDGRVANLSVDS